MAEGPSMRILLVEDNDELVALIVKGLQRGGFAADPVGNAADASHALATIRYAAVVLDLGLPDEDGLTWLRSVRARGDSTPVLVLTARDGVSDRVTGLRAGADDYLVKPFALEELLARVRALLRRTAAAGEQAALRFGDLELDPVAYTVLRGARALELTRTEFALLELFLRHPRQVLTRSIIFDRVWGYDFGPASNSL